MDRKGQYSPEELIKLEKVLVCAREIVEKNTGRPAYLATDEEWMEAINYAELDQDYRPPICPHCGLVAPYGDERLTWISIHLDSRLHRWWWRYVRRG